MKSIKRMMYVMLIALCLMFTATGTAMFFASEVPQPETTAPETEAPQPETEEIKGFEEKVVYAVVGQKVQLKPVGLTGKLRWTSSKKKVATVNKKGVIVPKKRGRTQITVFEGKTAYKCKLIVETPSISNTSLALLSGTSAQLEMKGTKQEVVWKVKGKQKVQVSETGLVTGLKKGTATVTAHVGKAKYSCKVTVEEPTLSTANLTIKCGETAKLNLNGTSKKAKWSSKNRKVASVKQGTVTAKKEGTTTIQAVVGNKTLTCKVNVIANPITAVKLSEQNLTLNKGEDKKLQAVISPSTAAKSHDITWTSSDNAIVKVDENGKLTAMEVGTATIKAEAGGKSDSCKVTVKPSMSMIYSEITNYVKQYGKRNEEGNLAVSTTKNDIITSIELNNTTGQLEFGYKTTSAYNKVRLSMICDVAKKTTVSPTLRYVTTDAKTEYAAAATVAASAIQKKVKLTWKMLNNTSKVQEGAIQTTCNSKFNQAMIEWQSILKACTGYNMSDIGFIAYK